MRAAVLHCYGVPRAEDFREPLAAPGQAVVEVLAAGLNPVDVSISAGRFYAGKPPLPCVVGREGVGMLEGARVYFDSPIMPFGSMAERALVEQGTVFPVPPGVEDGVAVALGISGVAAWLALTWRAQLKEGEHVLVLGASGVLGQIAVQAAKLLGAERVVAAARSRAGLERCLALGADAIVPMGEGAAADVPAALAEAAQERIDVVIDPLFGEPFAQAVRAASFGARLVHIGTAAGAEATLPSAAIRGKMLVIMGHSSFAAPLGVRRDAYLRLVETAAEGGLTVEVDPLPLERVEEAWQRLAHGSHRKIVLVPPAGVRPSGRKSL